MKEKEQDRSRRSSNNISLNKFRYWLLSFDLLDKDTDIRGLYQEGYLGENRLITYWPGDRLAASRLLFTFNDKLKIKELSEIYISPFEQFLDYRFILTLGKLNANSVKILSTNKHSLIKWEYFKKLQENLIFSFIYPHYLKENNRSILNEKINEYTLIKSPLILYMEPIEDNLLLDSNKNISQDKIRSLIKIIDSHRSLWSIIDDYILMTFLYTEYPWRGIIFLNTKKLAKNDKRIYLPEFVIDLLKQMACYHWLNYRKTQLLKSDLSTFDFQRITTTKDLKEISKSHKQVLSSLGQFYDYNIKLLDEIPDIKNFNNSFLQYFKFWKILEPDIERFRGPLTIKRLENEVTDLLESVKNYIEKLTSKSILLSNFSRDMLNTKISGINLRLQRLLIVLTVILALLTLIFTLDSFY